MGSYSETARARRLAVGAVHERHGRTRRLANATVPVAIAFSFDDRFGGVLCGNLDFAAFGNSRSLAGGLAHVANVQIRRLEQWKRLVAKHRLDDDIASRREVERVLCD